MACQSRSSGRRALVARVAALALGSLALVAPAATALADEVPAASILRLTPSTPQVRIGETVAFVAEVTNPTASDIVGVRIASDTTGDVASLLGARADRGVFDPATATWFIERVAPGDSATLEIFARADATGTARLALLAAAEEPQGTVGTADTSVEILSWRARPADRQIELGVTAGVLLTLGGVLIVAGLIYLNRRRHPDDAPITAQVASDPE